MRPTPTTPMRKLDDGAIGDPLLKEILEIMDAMR
jgi:hypothetical protein